MAVMTLATVPRYDNDRRGKNGRAVVVGASMAGLLAARVLADSFEAVTIIDRDPLPDEPIARRGVPQSNHIHILLEAGHSTLEDLFPGYGEELLSAGGLVIDGARNVNFFIEGDFLADRPRRIPLYCATRPLYEQIARRCVADIDSIQLRGNCQMTDYLVDDAGATVEGVVVRPVETGGKTEELSAELVVDATGRPSKTPNWLDSHGYTPPPVDEVHIDLAYSTILIERPTDDRRSFVVTPTPPVARGGGVNPVEGDRWLMTLFGMHGDYPPAEPEELIDFAAKLPDPHMKRLLDEHPRTSDDIIHYRFPANIRHRYEELDRFPGGLVVIGDAIASFNPIYAQGMSVAALEAVILHHTLSAGGREDLALRFFERAEKTIDIAWNMAVGSDHQFEETTGPKPRGSDFVNRYLSRLLRKAHTDAVLSDAFFRVLMMEQPPNSLLRPRTAWRVLRPTG
ncbi:FAD-dependent oxidoreductase [Haladaptatus sp. NG-SE-30]